MQTTMEGLLNKAPIGFEAESASVINRQNKYQLSLRAAVMDEPFMSPILGIVRVKFLSGRRTDGRTDGRRRLFPLSLLPYFSPSVTPLARRTSLQELVNIPWSDGRGRNVGNSSGRHASDSTPARVAYSAKRTVLEVFAVYKALEMN